MNANNNNNNNDYNNYKSETARKTMSTASIVCAVLALFTFQLWLIALPLAGVSVILALLSRGNEKLKGRARIAFFCGLAATAVSIIYTGSMIRMICNDPELRKEVERLYEYYTGQSVETKESETKEATASTENPQDLIRDILSGDYRKNRDSVSSGGSTDAGAPADSIPGRNTPDEDSSLLKQIQSGGTVI